MTCQTYARKGVELTVLYRCCSVSLRRLSEVEMTNGRLAQQPARAAPANSKTPNVATFLDNYTYDDGDIVR
jgi:hypothetical protein